MRAVIVPKGYTRRRGNKMAKQKKKREINIRIESASRITHTHTLIFGTTELNKLREISDSDRGKS